MTGAARAQGLTNVTYLTPFGYLISFIETMYSDVGGIFEKHGLNVTIEGGRGSSMAVQQVTAGNALISRTGGTDLIKAYATDPSIVAVGDIYQRDIFYVISAQDARSRSRGHGRKDHGHRFGRGRDRKHPRHDARRP
jgi:ABC-type nitrate/sulfonate/bicarbonate transport system substrate-binding protein